jgi:hypothetical protein
MGVDMGTGTGTDMDMDRVRVRAVTAALAASSALLLAAAPALAHHSFAMFDQSKTVELKGAVKEFRWTNPHVFIQLLVENESGADEEWSIEMTSPEHLARAGWRPGTLKPGDELTLTIHPMRDDIKGGQYLSGIGSTGPLLGSPAPKQQRGQGK